MSNIKDRLREIANERPYLRHGLIEIDRSLVHDSVDRIAELEGEIARLTATDESDPMIQFGLSDEAVNCGTFKDSMQATQIRTVNVSADLWRDTRAERNTLLASVATLREALETLNHAAKVAILTEYGNSFDEDTPLTIRLLDGTCDATEAALANPGATDALEWVRREATNVETNRWLTLIRSIDPERLCDVHDSMGIEEYLQAWLRRVKADALEEWADAEEVLDGEPPEDVIAYFRDKQAAVECLRAAVRSTLKSAKRKAAALRGGQ